MRNYTPFEERNISFLVNKNIDFTQVQITATGLKKSILDATAPMRVFFKEHGVHDYSNQVQGTENKVMLSTTILTETKEIPTRTSFYRPETKKGDPRLWIYGLSDYTEPDDIHILMYDNNLGLYAINLTRIDIPKCCESALVNPIKDFIFYQSGKSASVALELLGKLRKYEGAWIVTPCSADTAVGRKIETLLGIDMNASKEPDYHGIELKSFRSARPSVRKNLFCQVPNWSLSKVKSGMEIVDKYGYESGGIKSYRNTVYCKSPNAQGLQLNVNYNSDWLELIESEVLGDSSFRKIDDVAVWQLQTLHSRLLAKHHETFWIECASRFEEDTLTEQFKIIKIEHTKNPVVSQFDVLLEQSLITVDLLLGRPRFDAETGEKKSGGDSVSFKIKKSATGLLFPESEFYDFRQ